jgi:hypothetical protein
MLSRSPVESARPVLREPACEGRRQKVHAARSDLAGRLVCPGCPPVPDQRRIEYGLRRSMRTPLRTPGGVPPRDHARGSPQTPHPVYRPQPGRNQDRGFAGARRRLEQGDDLYPRLGPDGSDIRAAQMPAVGWRGLGSLAGLTGAWPGSRASPRLLHMDGSAPAPMAV